MAGLLHLPRPARNFAVIGMDVVPAAGFVDMAAGREGRPRRDADRAGGIGVAKPGPPVGQPVKRGRLHQRMAGGPEIARVMTVAHEDNEIFRVHPVRHHPPLTVLAGYRYTVTHHI